MVDKETMVHNEFTIIMIMIIRTPSPTPCTLTDDGAEAREDTADPAATRPPQAIKVENWLALPPLGVTLST